MMIGGVMRRPWEELGISRTDYSQKLRGEILDLLGDCDMTLDYLAEDLGATKHAVRGQLVTMFDRGLVHQRLQPATKHACARMLWCLTNLGDDMNTATSDTAAIIERMTSEQPIASAVVASDEPVDNPWREFIENCISGDNYFRTREWHDLLSDLDDLYRRAALASAPAAPVEWVSVSERLPDVPLFLVSSTRDDDESSEGIDQFEGMWVVRPVAGVDEESLRRWIERHEISHWMPLPAAPVLATMSADASDAAGGE